MDTTVPVTLKWTEADIVEALRANYAPITAIQNGVEEWSFLTQVRSERAFSHLPWAGSADMDVETRRYLRSVRANRTIDVLLMRNWQSGRGYERVAIEVKVSRADFFHDTAEKRAPWMELAHKFVYAVPKGLVEPHEVPDGCGLIEIGGEPCREPHAHTVGCGMAVVWNRKAKADKRVPNPANDGFAAVLARRASRAEGRMAAHALAEPGHGLSTPDGGDSAGPVVDAAAYAALLDKNRKLTLRLESVDRRIEQARKQHKALLSAYAQFLPQVCAECGDAVVPDTQSHGYRWTHKPSGGETSRTRDRVCSEASGVYTVRTRLEVDGEDAMRALTTGDVDADEKAARVRDVVTAQVHPVAGAVGSGERG